MLEDKNFARVVLQASDECPHPFEEEGGVIFSRDNEYCFAKINNIHQGTDTAIALYEAEKTSWVNVCLTNTRTAGLCSPASTHILSSPRILAI